MQRRSIVLIVSDARANFRSAMRAHIALGFEMAIICRATYQDGNDGKACFQNSGPSRKRGKGKFRRY